MCSMDVCFNKHGRFLRGGLHYAVFPKLIQVWNPVFSFEDHYCSMEHIWRDIAL